MPFLLGALAVLMPGSLAGTAPLHAWTVGAVGLTEAAIAHLPQCVECAIIGSDCNRIRRHRLPLSRAHKMLSEAAWRGAPLVEIIKSELSAFEKNLSVSGCDLFVNTTAAQRFALIVHELATNAAKHGALSSSAGKVRHRG